MGLIEKLAGMKIPAGIGEVYPGSYLLAKYLEQTHKGAKIYAVGDEGLKEELTTLDFALVEEKADVVAVGLDHTFDYHKLSIATRELRHGAILVTSNHDPNYPSDHGLMPGCGSLVAAIEAASEKKAYTVGKPNTFPFELISRERDIKKEEAIIVGDRLDSDVLFAKNCGLTSILVQSGYSKLNDIKDVRPDMVLESIATLPSNL